MSLFKLRDLWRTKCGKDEVFDPNSLLVADLRGQNYDHIVIGSHSGILRIYNPQFDLESEEYGNFKAIDLLIEVQLEEPILQISIGRLVSGSKLNHLAILHPKSVAVYNVVTLIGSTEHGDQSQVSMVYEHHLKRSAFSFIVGGFGGVQGRDFICVQGLDGTLMFYEQETLSLTRKLETFLLPSPMVYIPHTDSFIILNSNWFLESYRYQVLGEESSELLPSWSINLGEEIIDMKYISLTTTEAAIYILTERNFYCFGETGVLKFTKRLQYIPLCCHIFGRGEPSVMAMIVTESNNLLVYEDTKLKWAAQLHLTPTAISRGSLEGLQGCLVLLTEEGELECGYLGTEPSVFVPPPLQESVTNNSDLETKLALLQHQIAGYSNFDKESLGAPTQKSEVKLTVKAWSKSPEERHCTLEISVVATSPVHNVNISVEVCNPVEAEPSTHFIPNLSDSAEVSSRISVQEGDAWDFDCTIVCGYLCGDKCGVVTADVQLPLRLVLELAPPSQGHNISLTFTASQVVILPAIFPDFSADSWNLTNSNEYSAGFVYRNNPSMNFTISLNRPAFKYRIEGDSVTSLTLPVCIFAKKLANKHLKSGQYSVGLNDLFLAIDENISLRNLIREIEVELKQGCGQMRAVQRRLLGKMRDKTPSDMNPLSSLIEYTHNYVMDAADRMEKAQNDLVKNGLLLGNLIQFTITMIKLTNAAVDEVNLLYQAISHTQHISENQGWAEITQVALSHLLKTSLARSVRDQFAAEPSEEVITKSFNIKKQIATAIDRIVKGHRPVREERAVSPIMEGEDEEVKERHGGLYDEIESEEIKNILDKFDYNLDHL